MTTKLDTLHSQLAGALRRAQKLHTEALPKFNWGASALDAHAIQLLNEVPGDVAAALAQYDAAAAQQAAHTFHVEPTPVLAQGSVTLTLQLTPEWVDSVLCTAIESADYGWLDWTDIVQGRDPELRALCESVGRRDDVFTSPDEFVEHHGGDVSRIVGVLLGFDDGADRPIPLIDPATVAAQLVAAGTAQLRELEDP